MLEFKINYTIFSQFMNIFYSWIITYFIFLGDIFLKGKIEVFGEELEYDFITGWIKYNRLQRGYSQEALSYGICYSEMNMFKEAEIHYKAALTGAKHYNIDKLFYNLYVSLIVV